MSTVCTQHGQIGVSWNASPDADWLVRLQLRNQSMIELSEQDPLSFLVALVLLKEATFDVYFA